MCLGRTLSSGISGGHAYTVTGFATARGTELIRVRDPWGTKREWRGAWSDGSREWNQISDSEKQQLGLRYDHDGEFWMSFEDFCRQYVRVSICHKADVTMDESLTLKLSQYEGSWVRGVSAGGSSKYVNTIHTNPQYKVTLRDTDDADNVCTLTVALMQKYSRGFSNPKLKIGFSIYSLTSDAERYIRNDRMTQNFFMNNRPVVSSYFASIREIVKTVELPPGNYILIPSTVDPNYEGYFYLRVLTEKSSNRTAEMESEILSSAGHENENLEAYSDYQNEDSKMVQMLRPTFDALAGSDEYISAPELITLFQVITKNEPSDEKADISHALAIMALFDKDNTGKLDFNEFMTLYHFYEKCKSLFTKYAKGGKMSAGNVRYALENLDINLPRSVIGSAIQRYGNERGNFMTFCNFVALTSKVKAVIGTCSKDDDDNISTACSAQVLEKFLLLALKF